MTTNEYERDLNDQAGLKRPGRVDFRVFQNTADAGDGHPGIQRCFRNYLHEGGMEKDLELIGYGIKGTSVDLTNAKLQEFSNIGSTTITGAQWVFVGEADQPVKQADSPTFAALTINGNITITGNVDGVDVSVLKTNFDSHKSNDGSDHSFINQDVKTTFSPTFVGLTLSADLVTTSTVDSVNISTFKTDYDTHKISTGADHTYIDQSVVITTSPTFVGLTLSADLVTSSTIDGVDVSDFKTEFEAFNAIGAGNAQYIGLVYEHSWNYGQDFNLQQVMFANKGGTGAEIMNFTIPLACDKGSYSLKLDDIILWLTDADGTNKIEGLTIYGIQNDSTQDMLYDEEADRTSPGTYIYDISNFDCAGYWKIVVMVRTTSASTDRIEFAAPILKYFYS